MGLCSLASPILTLVQQVLNTLFGFFSFLGVSAPDVSDLVGPVLGC